MSTTLWRIDKLKRVATAFCGDGSRLYGGRWNSVGNRVVYAASSLSLAAWEVFVHLGIEAESSLIQFMAIQAEIPDSVVIEKILAHQLPQNWKTDPAPESLQAIGDKWLKASTAAVLRVPSVVIPQEDNYLLNPQHPEFAKISVTRLEPFIFDPRVWRK